MRNRLPPAFVAVLVALAFGGCSCEDSATRKLPVELSAPSQLSFGDPICNESLSHEQFDIENTGGGNTSIALSIVGEDAAFFTVEPTEASLNGIGSLQTVTVTYHPTDELAGGEPQRGERHVAEVEIAFTDENGDRQSKTILLDGEVRDMAVEPLVSFACGTGPDGAELPRCSESTGEPCCSVMDMGDGTYAFESLGFGTPKVGTTAALPLQIQNKGCGELEVTTLDFDQVGGTCEASAAQLVGESAPLNIPGGLGEDEGHDFALEFTPGSECGFTGRLVVESLDAMGETVRKQLTVLGNGIAPQLVTSRDLVFFGEVAPGTQPSPVESFNIRNTGSAPIHINSITLENDYDNTLDFSILKMEKTECDGATEAVTIPGSGYDLAPTDSRSGCGDDELVVFVQYTPSEPADQDKATITIDSDELVKTVELRGGTDPVLTGPDEVEFMPPNIACGGGVESCTFEDNLCQGMCRTDEDCGTGYSCHGASETADGNCIGETACAMTCGSASSAVEFCNSGVAPLKFSGFTITDSSNGPAPTDPVGNWEIFSVAAENCTTGDLAQGECCTAEIEFQDKSTGGGATAYLIPQTNDPVYEQDPFLVVLRALTTPNAIPNVAWTQSPTPAMVDGWVTIDASPIVNSDGEYVGGTYDKEGPIASYKWTLVEAQGANPLPEVVIDPNDPNADCPPSHNGGECFEFPLGADEPRIIRFFPTIAGEYKWKLEVEDSNCAVPHRGHLEDTVYVSNL